MTLLSAIILGLVQGVTEFLPVSSSGHLAIAEHLLNISAAAEIPGFFDVLLHLGTLIAVFIAYRTSIADMIRELAAGVQDIAHGTTPSPLPPARRLILLILFGTLPLFLVLPIKDRIEAMSENMYFVGLALMVTGCILRFSDLAKKGRKTERSAGVRDVLIVGAAQAIATFPGISRSGSTIAAGCIVGFDRRFAVRYSFLLSIPAILGANLLTLPSAIAELVVADIPVYLVGFLVAAGTGYACIWILRKLVEQGRFGLFAYYCWAAGIVTVILNLIQG